MAEDKVYTPQVIADQPFPVQDEAIGYDTSTQSTKDVYQVDSIKPQGLPPKRIAYELLGSALNTKSRKILGEFELVQSGGFQIGKYINGVSGDLRITPNGITARDKAGITTFSIDGTTGDATFKGTIQAKDFIVADENGLVSLANFKNDSVTSETVQSTISTTYSVLDSMTITTPDFQKETVVLILFSVVNSLFGNDANSFAGGSQFIVYIDGSNQPDMYLAKSAEYDSSTGEKQGLSLSTNSIHFLQSLSPGKHTIEVKWSVAINSGAPKANAYRRTLSYTSLG